MSTTETANAMADKRHGPERGPEAAKPQVGPEGPESAPLADQESPAQLQAELADTKDKLLRALAEQENIRRQMQRQRDEAVRFAASKLAGDLVDTLDNLRRAIESAPPEAPDHAVIKPLLKGVETTEGKLLATLALHGLRRVDPLGAVFDPHIHDAIFQRFDATVPEGTVVEVLQPGYMLHDRVLRPAMVGVAVHGSQDGGAAVGQDSSESERSALRRRV
jgi:molecular chaperone GrpE